MFSAEKIKIDHQKYKIVNVILKARRNLVKFKVLVSVTKLI